MYFVDGDGFVSAVAALNNAAALLPRNTLTQLHSNTQVYFVDGDETPVSAVAALNNGSYVPVCYFSAGSWEKCERAP